MSRMPQLLLLIVGDVALLAGCGHATGDASGSTNTAVPHQLQAVVPANAAASAASTRANDEAGPASLSPQGNRWDSQAQQLVPLTKDDVEFYLTVMRAAAERIRHPTAADQATRERGARIEAAMQGAPAPVDNSAAMDKLAKQIMDGKVSMADGQKQMMKLAQAQLASSRAASLSDQDRETMLDAALMEQQMDEQIVKERHLDDDRYDWAKGKIEDIIIPPALDAQGDCGGDCGGPSLSSAQIAFGKSLAAVQAQDTRLLEPYRSEIQALQAVVRPSPGTRAGHP